MFRKWIGTSRYVYNRCLSEVKKGEEINFFSLRNKYVTFKNNDNIESWELETPKDIRAGAIQDLVAGYKTSMSNLKAGNINSFNLRFRKKKEVKSIRLPSSCLKKNKNLKSIYIYKTYTKQKIKVSKDKSLNYDIEHDFRLQNKNGKWFICIPIKKETNKEVENNDVCSLDPGIINFQTIYSNKEIITIKVNRELQEKLRKKLDLLSSLRSKKEIKYRNYIQSRNKIYNKMNNQINELHNKTINYLVTNYKTIIIPTFENQEIVGKIKSKKNKRELLSLQHYSFKHRLQEKSKTIRGCLVIETTEEYTSKTCSSCGKIQEIKNKRTYNCENCNLEIDRDVNGSRCIMIKTIMEMT